MGWYPAFVGQGIIDAAALLAAPLADGVVTRAETAEAVEDLPLWASIYPEGTGLQVAKQDYARVFRLAEGADPESVAIYEAEVMYHYATNAQLREAIDRVAVGNDRSQRAYDRIREELRARDLSASLRRALAS